MLTRVLLLLLVASLAILTSEADAAPDTAVLAADATGPAVTDGVHLIAFVPRVGSVRVMDTQAGTSFDADVRGGCAQPPSQPIAAGGGQVLIACGVPMGLSSPEPRLLDVETRALHEPAGARAVLEDAADDAFGNVGIAFEDVGVAGLSYFHAAYHGDYVGLLDWHTGDRIGEGRADQAIDLDRTGLYAPLCNPLRRVATNDETDGPAFYPYAYEAPYGLASRGQLDVRSGSPTLTLQRCGGRRQLVLDTGDPQDAQLRAGVATWTSAYAPHAYLTACGVELVWRGARFVNAAHTREDIVVSRADRSPGPWRIELLDISDLCRRTHAAWTLTASAGHGSVRAQAQAATLSLPSLDGAVATFRPLVAPATPRLAPTREGIIRLRPDGAARALSWRLGTGVWHRSRAHGDAWRIAVGRLSGPRTLTVHVRFRQGGAARFAVRL